MNKRIWFHKYVRLAVTAGLLTWVALDTDWANVSNAFRQMRVEWWLAAVAMLVTTQLISAWRWQALARPFGFERKIRQMASYYFVGMYFNLLLPTSVGGDVVRAWYLDGGTGRRLAALGAVFLDRFSGLVVLLCLACIGLLLTPLELPAWIGWFVWTTTACAAVAIAVTPWLTRRGARIANSLHKVRAGLEKLRAPDLLLGSTALSLGVQAGNVILVWLVGQSISADVPAGYYWIMVPMVSLLTMLPVSINGWGVRENATVLFLAPLGIAKDTAVTLSLLWFAVFLAGSLMGGAVYLFGNFPRVDDPALAPDFTEVDHGSVDHRADQGRTRQHHSVA
ncbi:MAG TPA: lysylphosphatidylglycerol synthase transmembrane domain-containing protein [Gemmataceae bacterium]|nr:lysylphosphatidylglycerol synthase transmembrane domain-containing protein [Gemmataceae bacterium]